VAKLKGELGSLERGIMDVIWDDPGVEVSVRDILGSAAGRGLAYTTVMTVLDRLWRKGYLARRRDGRAYLYTAARTREDHVESLVAQVLAGVGDRKSALLGLVRGVDDEDIESLRSAIRQVRKERRTAG
jgi:predicted transcriptional regulator